MNKTIEEFKAAKNFAEKSIFTILNGLEKEYGVSIEEVGVNSQNISFNGQGKKEKLLLSVGIEVRL